MKLERALLGLALLAMVWPATTGRAQVAPAQSFVASASPMEMDPMAADAPDNKLYLEGTRAINEGRWADAVGIFTRVAGQKSDHAAGALYWKAYAENKQGQASHALETCAALRKEFSASSWKDECGALEIEIRAASGKPVAPGAEQSDDLKLLALNSLLQRDEAKARAQIADILAGDSSEQLKEGALFLLGKTVPDANYAQIVRVSAVEGDVRVARASQNQKAKDATWEQAVANLPLLAGDSIVTGKGRAEIEFENASTIYLAPNSVLNCYDMHSTSGVPHTEIALLSGTVTLQMTSLMPGETFTVDTPTDSLVTRYPQAASLRLSSYVDGIAVTSLGAGTLNLPAAGRQAITGGETQYFHNGARISQISADMSADRSDDLAAFDKWVAATHAARAKATHEVMQAAGLTVPIPGLAEMKDKGTFFDCAPYGTCWEPSIPSETHQASEMHQAPAEPAFAAPQTLAVPQGFAAPLEKKPQASGSGIAPALLSVPDSGFPCLPSALRYWYLKDPFTGHSSYVGSGFESGGSAYDWAVCHSGSWIYHHNHYVWVVGHRRHHHDPVYWVKNGRTVAYVPIHPRDVKGQTPLNREHGLVPTHDKDGFALRETVLDSARPVELMKSPPREFRSEHFPILARAESPHMEIRALKNSVAGNGNVARPGSIPLSFDHRSQTFVMPHQVVQGNHSVTVFSPLGNQGGSGSRTGGGVAQGGSSGGSHSGGSSGGGAHSGGTTSSSAPASSISVSSSSASSTTSAHH